MEVIIRTKEDEDKLLSVLEKHGFEWLSGHKPTWRLYFITAPIIIQIDNTKGKKLSYYNIDQKVIANKPIEFSDDFEFKLIEESI